MTTTAGIIASFNQAEYISEAVASLANQVDEVVVVDDASTDNSFSILEKMEIRNLRVLRNVETLGVSRTLNRAIESSSAEVILLQGGDDRSLRSRARIQVKALSDPKVAVVYSNPRVINSAGKRMPDSLAAEFLQPSPIDPLAALALGNNFICAPAAAFRRDPFLALGGFRPGLDLLQDHDLWLRFSEEGNLLKIQDRVVEYRKHGTNVSRDYTGLDSAKRRRVRVEQEYIYNQFLFSAKPESRDRIARSLQVASANFHMMSRVDQITFLQLAHPDAVVIRQGVKRVLELANGPDPEESLSALGLDLRDLNRLTFIADHDNVSHLSQAVSNFGRNSHIEGSRHGHH